MKKMVAIAAILTIIFAFTGGAYAQQNFSPVGKSFKVVSVKGIFSMGGSDKDSFQGGRRSFIKLQLKFTEIDNSPSNQPNVIVDDTDDKNNADVTYITIRISAFDENRPYKKLCFQQFNTMLFRYENAEEVTVHRWTRDCDWDYQGIIRITTDGSNDLMIHPNQVSITKVKAKE